LSVAAAPIRSWSTQTVPAEMQFDYWMSIMRTALWPVTEYSKTSADFRVDLQEAPLGCLSSMIETIGPHHARRTRRDVDRTEESCYHLFLSLGATWGLAHQGHNERLRRGDIVLVGEGEHETFIPSGFEGVILKCPAHWVSSWLPDPELLIGRGISRDSRWGRVLSPMLSQLTPRLATDAPLPASVLMDQLGAVLALAASDTDFQAMPDLLKKILVCIRERCTEPELNADAIAATLRLPAPFLHRVLAGSSLTFAPLLLDARVAAALAMLVSPSFNRLTITEIGRRAGFKSGSHFARVIRNRTGRTPLQLRRADTLAQPH